MCVDLFSHKFRITNKNTEQFEAPNNDYEDDGNYDNDDDEWSDDSEWSDEDEQPNVSFIANYFFSKRLSYHRQPKFT